MPRKRTLKLAAAVLLTTITLLVAAFVTWALTPLGPSKGALKALESSAEVKVTQAEYGWVFTPTDTAPVTGIVFYPGGRVDPRSYAPLARELALAGHLVVIEPMTLNLAVLSPDRAADAIAANPDIKAWAMAGHSLGGTMAAQYAAGDPERVKALVLLASYPAQSTDLAGSSIEVVSVFGTRDGVLNQEAFKAAAPRLPESTEYVAIDGGNHAQFGSYGPQPGDNEATITADDQLYRTVDAVASELRSLRLYELP